MSDLILKAKVLRWLISNAFGQWRNFKKQDLDEYYCCNGNECGCRGMTIRDVYLHQTRPTNSAKDNQ